MDKETRQQRRARERARETRREQFDRIHGRVLEGRTVLDLWRLYWDTLKGKDPMLSHPAIEAFVRQAFYSGTAAMLELMTRVSPDDVTEEQGVEMLQRLHEELETYARGLR